MLILGISQHERIIIKPSPFLDPSLTVAELFADGPIVITPLKVPGRSGLRRVGIASTQHLHIEREALDDLALDDS